MERGAVTSTIAAGSLRGIDGERGRKRSRKRKKSITRKKIGESQRENRSANGVARDAALIISNGSCELLSSASWNCFPTVVRNNLCSHWRSRALKKRENGHGNRVTRGATPHRAAIAFAERKDTADTSRRDDEERWEEIHKSSQKTAVNSILFRFSSTTRFRAAIRCSELMLSRFLR